MYRVAYTVLSVLALSFGLEGATRVDEWLRWGSPVFSSATSVNHIIAIDSNGAHGIPNARYRKFALNSAGLRGPELTSGRPRILVLGASESFGLYESEGKEYPRQLEDSLAAAGCRVDVLNAALPGFSIPTLLASFRHSIAGLNGAVAVIYPSPAQYLDLGLPRFIPPQPGQRLTAPSFAFRSATRLRDHAKLTVPDWLKTVLRGQQIESRRRQLAGQALWTTVPQNRIEAFDTDVSALVDSLQEHGATVMLATHATAFPPNAARDPLRLTAWSKFFPHAESALIPAFDSVANLRLARIAARRKLALSDVGAAFHTRAPADHFADFSHFTDAGAAITAGVMARDLLRTVGCPLAR